MSVSYYGYEELRKIALADDATQAGINRLGEWFDRYGSAYWNGEYYDAGDDVRLFPIYEPINEGEDQFEVVGYELRR